MSVIRVLPDQLISQIAAGEVIERPASVVKEAIENALDASARRVSIRLEAGGREVITVRDDGDGMSREDLELAFRRHATSKIRQFEDLERVATLGFRGEALASIAAVAEIVATSAMAPGEGHRLTVDGGELVSLEPVAAPRGTELIVRSLFRHVPARRKFLKGASTEQRRCVEVVQGYALARPDVAWTVSTPEQDLLDASATSPDSSGRLERIAQLFGSELAANLLPLERSRRVSGFVGNRRTVRGRRVFTYVNGRLIRDRALMAVFYRAVRTVWKSEDRPALFLFLELDPEEVDVNVHPQKAEVRFRERHRLGEVSRVLQEALGCAVEEGEAPLRTVDPAGGRPPAVWEAPPAWGRQDETSDGGQSGLREVVYEPSAARPASVPLGRGAEGRSLRLLGQYKGSVVLLEGPDALYLVDQHAAHERILYERFRHAEAQRPLVAQRLVSPLELELPVSEVSALAAAAEELEEFGFEILPTSSRRLGVVALPATVPLQLAESVLTNLAGRLARAEGADGGVADLRRQLLEALAASRACRTAVRIHHPLGVDEMQRLVSELFESEEPYACPHGRPTVLKMTDADLERRFGRR